MYSGITKPFGSEIKVNQAKEKETVNHPQHYGGDTTYEVIKVLEAWGILDFCLGNSIKYIARAGKKHENILEDLKKAQWYLNRKIEQLESAHRIDKLTGER